MTAHDSGTIGILTLGILVLVVAVLFWVADGCHSCTAPDASRETLQKAGYRNIIIKERRQFFVCGDDDTFATGFVATNPAGDRVEGTVCCGVALKGCTIRF